MQTTLTVRLSEKEAENLQQLCEMTGKSASEVVGESLRAQVLRRRLDALRRELVPRAQAIGWLTEEDIFRDVS